MTDVYNFVLQNYDQQKCTCVIFLGLKKAFHCVDHQILLSKFYKTCNCCSERLLSSAFCLLLLLLCDCLFCLLLAS